MKRNQKFSNYFLFFSVSIFVVSVIAVNRNRVLAFLDLPQTTYLIENKNSALLSQLFLAENKPKGFAWYKVVVTQSTNNNPSGINPTIETVTAYLGGYFEGNDVGIFHQIRQYTHAEKLDGSYLDPNIRDSFSETFASMDWLNISDIQAKGCVSNADNSTQCHADIVIRDRIISFVVNYQSNDPLQVKQLMNILLEAQFEKSK